jgi:membrane protein involved in colicin uptake
LLARIEAKKVLKAQQALEEEQNAGKPLKAKPKKKAADTSLDDLLSAGLSGGKKAPKK